MLDVHGSTHTHMYIHSACAHVHVGRKSSKMHDLSKSGRNLARGSPGAGIQPGSRPYRRSLKIDDLNESGRFLAREAPEPGNSTWEPPSPEIITNQRSAGCSGGALKAGNPSREPPSPESMKNQRSERVWPTTRERQHKAGNAARQLPIPEIMQKLTI